MVYISKKVAAYGQFVLVFIYLYKRWILFVFTYVEHNKRNSLTLIT